MDLLLTGKNTSGYNFTGNISNGTNWIIRTKNATNEKMRQFAVDNGFDSRGGEYLARKWIRDPATRSTNSEELNNYFRHGILKQWLPLMGYINDYQTAYNTLKNSIYSGEGISSGDFTTPDGNVYRYSIWTLYQVDTYAYDIARNRQNYYRRLASSYCFIALKSIVEADPCMKESTAGWIRLYSNDCGFGNARSLWNDSRLSGETDQMMIGYRTPDEGFVSRNGFKEANSVSNPSFIKGKFINNTLLQKYTTIKNTSDQIIQYLDKTDLEYFEHAETFISTSAIQDRTFYLKTYIESAVYDSETNSNVVNYVTNFKERLVA